MKNFKLRGLLPLFFVYLLTMTSSSALGQDVDVHVGDDVDFYTWLQDNGDPIYIPATSLLPALPVPYVDPEIVCKKQDSNKCVEKLIKAMVKRWEPLDKACDHKAVFAFLYLRTTEAYLERVQDPNFFTDNNAINNQDLLFGLYYIWPYDAWLKGETQEIPPAWKAAFSAADNKSVQGYGDLLSGMVAHIVRDLPFVLYQIGMVNKEDHDKVNRMLLEITKEVLKEAAERYDPAIDDIAFGGDSTDLDATLVNFSLQALREGAWRDAEALSMASSDFERMLIARQIELKALAEVKAIQASYHYLPLLNGAAQRRAYCEAQKL